MKKPPYSNISGPWRGSIWGGAMTNYTNGIVQLEGGVFTSVRTPSFKQYKNRSLLPLNAFEHVHTCEIVQPGVYATDGNYPVYYDGYCAGQITRSSQAAWRAIDFSDADRIARNKILAQLGDMSVNLAQAFAERKQTVGLMAKSVNRLASAAIAIRRGNLRHACDLFGNVPRSKVHLRKEVKPSKDNLANYWLEYSYGWRPLISDIYGSAELIANTYYLKKSSVVRAGGSSKQIANYVKSVGTSGFNTPPVNVYNEDCRFVSLSTVRYMVEYREDNAFLARMAQTGISNPALLAWELVPYSFVLDWFLPVGTYLKNMSACNGLYFYRGTKTEVGKANHSTRWTPVSVTNSKSEKIRTGLTRIYLDERKKRVILSSFPSAPVPAPQMPFQMGQFFSGLALLTQAFKR